MKISRISRNRVFYIPFLIVLASCLSLTKQTRSVDSLDILKKLLDQSFFYEVSNEQAHLSYCPDNTCLIFSGEKQNLNQLSDFSLLYLYHVSSYVYLARNMHGNGNFFERARLAVEQLENNYSISCPAQFDMRVSCVMQKFVMNNDFYIHSIRLDEGEKVFTAVGLEKKLGELQSNAYRKSK